MAEGRGHWQDRGRPHCRRARAGRDGHPAPRHSLSLHSQHQRVTARHCHHGKVTCGSEPAAREGSDLFPRPIQEPPCKPRRLRQPDNKGKGEGRAEVSDGPARAPLHHRGPSAAPPPPSDHQRSQSRTQSAPPASTRTCWPPGVLSVSAPGDPGGPGLPSLHHPVSQLSQASLSVLPRGPPTAMTDARLTGPHRDTLPVHHQVRTFKSCLPAGEVRTQPGRLASKTRERKPVGVRGRQGRWS